MLEFAGWVFDHLDEEGFIESDNDELLSDLDNYLFEIMNSEMKNGNYAFLHAGIGLTIIDHIGDFETNWDECLMIS